MRPIEILLVEDNPGDVRLTQEALSESRMQTHMSVVYDGHAAMEFLHQNGEYANAPRPDLILLDLNLPKMSGQDVLDSIKGDEGLKYIPVVALTTSGSEKDIRTCYDKHVNCYITKPMSYEPFLDVVRSIENFWLNLVKLPRPQLR